MGARLCIAAILAFWAALAPEAGAQAGVSQGAMRAVAPL
jgi:hypothetical protein